MRTTFLTALGALAFLAMTTGHAKAQDVDIPCSQNLVGNKAACLMNHGSAPIVAGRCNGYDVPVIGNGPRGAIMPNSIGLIVVPDSCSAIQLKDATGTIHTMSAWDWRRIVRAQITSNWSLGSW